MGVPSLLLKSLPLGFTFGLNLFFAATEFWQARRVNITAWSIWERASGSGDGGRCLRLQFCFQSLSVVSTSITVTTAKKNCAPRLVLPWCPSGLSFSASRLSPFLAQVSEVW